ncbi:hypothetical protein N9Y17_01985, partial [Gammaproteobacteria bacterium]|nr:hypothetical protein [Gammaproteobacteria bacterium]
LSFLRWSEHSIRNNLLYESCDQVILEKLEQIHTHNMCIKFNHDGSKPSRPIKIKPEKVNQLEIWIIEDEIFALHALNGLIEPYFRKKNQDIVVNTLYNNGSHIELTLNGEKKY